MSESTPTEAVLESLVAAIRGQLRGDESATELRELLCAAAIPETLHDAILERFVPPPATSPPPPPDRPVPPAPVELPRLLVDWGDPPRIGHRARPRFSLVCPAAFRSRPVVHVEVDNALDDEGTGDPLPVEATEGGGWEFHARFGLTTRGEDCRPGAYLMRVAVRFADVDGIPGPVCLITTIRLVAGEGGEGTTLEIEGDGQSVVNLHGQDLRRFGKVVLRGRDTSLLNLESSGDDGVGSDTPVHEYRLRIDGERQSLVPRVLGGGSPEPLDKADLVLDDGCRITLHPGQVVTLGRQRDNDIVTRFHPRSPENDDRSRKLSRTHLLLNCTESGLRLEDRSATGVCVGRDHIDGDLNVAAAQLDPVDLALGEPASAYRVRLRGFAPGEPGASSRIAIDEETANACGVSIPPSWRTAEACGWDALRLTPLDGVPGHEHVLLLRAAAVGSRSGACPIRIGDAAPIAGYVRHLAGGFWWAGQPGESRVSVDDVPVSVRALVPLRSGSRVRIGAQSLMVEARS